MLKKNRKYVSLLLVFILLINSFSSFKTEAIVVSDTASFFAYLESIGQPTSIEKTISGVEKNLEANYVTYNTEGYNNEIVYGTPEDVPNNDWKDTDINGL